MTLDSLTLLPPDSILGLMTAYNQDASPDKLDLTVGIYRDADGETPVFRAVKQAEAQVIAEQTTKAYVPPAGVAGFRSRIAELILGDIAESASSRIACIQTTGGCGALRIAADLYRRARPDGCVMVSAPTWGNHHRLLGAAGLGINAYAYYDCERHAYAASAMLDELARVPTHSLVVLQAACHNPTGADPDASDWNAILDIVQERSLLPLFDVAYQGMGVGVNEDVAPIRRALERLPALLVAVSASKNFGLYRERTGALLMVAESASRARVLESQVLDIARGIYSMPPAHGALILERLLGDPQLCTDWLVELDAVRRRIEHSRRGLKEALSGLRPDIDFEWLMRQRGLFSLLGIPTEAVEELREVRHIYMLGDSRINLAGLNEATIPVFAEAISPYMTS